MVEKAKKTQRRDSKGQPVSVSTERVPVEDKKKGSGRRFRVTQ